MAAIWTTSRNFTYNNSFPNKLIAEKYPGERNPLFEFIYDLQ